MREHSGMYPVKKMADVLQVSRSHYYAWLKKPLNARKQQDSELLSLVKRIFEENRQAYGSPRIHLDLQDMGHHCSKKRVARIMRENGICVRLKKKYKATTDSEHTYPVAENLLRQEFFVETANKVWVSDITYIWTMEGWLYLCIILDLYSRMAVGWSLDSRIGASLATSALSMAVLHRNPPEGLIIHSDRGVQYASKAFRKEIEKHKIIQSMSRKGNCWDNACAESFFATLKSEEVFRRSYKTREEAQKQIFEYIAVYYNRLRKHSYLDYLSPEEFESRGGWIASVA
jgi:putative transposase